MTLTKSMGTRWAKFLLVPLVAATLAGCSASADTTPPSPIAMTEDSVGYYCQMYVLDHGGPKAQIHLKGLEQPLWFSQVSDAAAYLHDKERDREIVAVYVSDMAKAASWGEPGATNWIDADGAYFVIGSKQMGGMGTPDAISFAAKADAEAFHAQHGGTVVAFADIPEGYGAVAAVEAAAAEAILEPGA
jgi:copper chaperone NosL